MRYKVNDPENNGKNFEDIKRHSDVDWCSWKREQKSKNETKLVAIIGLLVFIVIALVITLILRISILNKNDYEDMCQTEKCINTAARLMESINTSVNPCNDFYKYACDGWISQHPIPQSQTSWDQLSHLRERLFENLRIILEEDDLESDLRPMKLARALYRTCMDTATIENLGLEPIFQILKMVQLPEKPIFNESIEFDIATISGTVQRHLGLNIFINFYISEDIRNTSRNRMMMEQVSPGFSERYLLDSGRFSSEINEYKRYIKAMVELAGINDNSTEFANELVDFSTSIAKIMATPEERRSSTHLLHDVTVDELQQLTDLHAVKWNWTSYIQSVFKGTNVTIDSSKDRVIVMDLLYLQNLPQLLASTHPTTVARFVWWNIYATIAPLTLQKFRDLGFQFAQKVFGLKEKTPRWKTCTGNVNSMFGMALTHLYVQKHFNEQAKEKALEMLLDIRAAFDEMVSELEWMDTDTRAKAHKKLNAMKPFVGFPEWIMDAKKLNDYYKEADVVEGKLFKTFLSLTNVGINKTLNSLREKPDKNRWISAGTTVNAFYSAILNSVTFPAGILHPPFYENGLESLNYGAMGAIMGHELTHGFDDQGRRYDEDGNLRQWWSDETLQHYHKKVECIIKQYSNYHLPELNNNFTVNGINTQSENIADNGGLREAYRAYQISKARNPNSQSLPGLYNYTQDQLFFLGFAQVWCGNYTYGALKSKLVEGAHAPNHFRVIGTLSNNIEFAKAWNCPVGSPMNPPNKCILW
ncbi:neprilysin-4-like [Chelonus insularis]|uniref:neprilysin-4-like n=1 Tax=Chelonus insularis TaxID=460826 RepID=UPI00158F25F4|nr:neprilysin-4-like [Chelonus insularis]XP_034947044.1 neprilysin-4-like [Chelonus insularis]